MGIVAFWVIGTAIFAAITWAARMFWPLLALGLIVAGAIWLFKITVNFGASVLSLEVVYVFHRDIVAEVTRQARLEHRFVMRGEELHLAGKLVNNSPRHAMSKLWIECWVETTRGDWPMEKEHHAHGFRSATVSPGESYEFDINIGHEPSNVTLGPSTCDLSFDVPEDTRGRGYAGSALSWRG